MCLLSGADIIVKPSIQIRFVPPTSYFARCPVAHTCGCVLTLQDNYENMSEIKTEFDNIFKSNVWVMDIV